MHLEFVFSFMVESFKTDFAFSKNTLRYCSIKLILPPNLSLTGIEVIKISLCWVEEFTLTFTLAFKVKTFKYKSIHFKINFNKNQFCKSPSKHTSLFF